MRFKVALTLSLLLHSLLLFVFMELKPVRHAEGKNTLVVSLKTLSVKKEKKKIVPRKIERKRPKKRRSPTVNKKTERVVKKRTPKTPILKEKPAKEEPKEEVKSAKEDVAPKPVKTEEEVLTAKAEDKTLHYEPPVEYPIGLGEDEEEEETNYQEEYVEENLEVIRDIVSRYMSYPPVARRMGWEGTVVVRFLLTPSGVVEEESIEKSSGHELLDRNALNVVRVASKEFPRPSQNVVVVLPIVYRLE